LKSKWKVLVMMRSWITASCCIHLHTSRLAIHLTPSTRHPEASHANCKMFQHGFSVAGAPNTHGFCVLGWVAEGPALLPSRAIQDGLDDRGP